MAGLEVKNIGTPDETRPFGHGKLEVVTLTGIVFGKATFEPGWRWSQSVKPIAGTDSCQVHHNGYVVSGRMHVVMDDGSEGEAGPGDVMVIPPGHDAWTSETSPASSSTSPARSPSTQSRRLATLPWPWSSAIKACDRTRRLGGAACAA